MATKTYEKDEAGNIIDPPVLGDWERRISDAQASGDDNLVHALQTRYHDERNDVVGEIERADTDAPDSDDLGGTDHTDAGDLVENNSYDDLRNAARARDLPTSGGKIDLANRIAEHEGGNAAPADTDNDDDE